MFAQKRVCLSSPCVALKLETHTAAAARQLRAEMNETVNGRIDMLSSINTALQNVSAKLVVSKPYRISDFIPRNWEVSNDNGKYRHLMSNLHLWNSSVIKRRRNNACQRRENRQVLKTTHLQWIVQMRSSDQSRRH